MPYFLAIFALIFVELTLFIEAGSKIGALATVALVFLTAVVGISIIMRQGMNTMLKAQAKAVKGEAPAKEIIEGILLGVAAVCLLIPGFLTDGIGFLLLTPVRSAIATTTLGRWIVRSPVSPYRRSNEDIIDGEYKKLDD